MYVDTTNTSSNYEYLFNLTDGADGDPGPGSLFCIQTLKQFVTLGEAAPNILKDTSLVYGVSFTLVEDWTALTATLGFNDVKQTYMMWLWLDTAWDLTFARIQDGGNV